MNRPSQLVRIALLIITGTVLSGIMLMAQSPSPKRTLLLEIRNIRDEQLRKLLPPFGDPPDDPVLSHVRDTALILASRAEAELLKERGVRFTILLQDTSRLSLVKRAHYGPSMRMPPAYHTYAQILQEADALIRAHPDRIRSLTIGETSRDKRPIAAFQIGASVATRSAKQPRDVPAVMFNGCHHADEVAGAEICTALMHELVEGTDSTVVRWRNDLDIYIIPVVNVDGHAIVTGGTDPEWRKNGRGVDINRNYDFNWAQGGSDDPASERYRGPFPFSESENRAVRNFLQERKILLSITYHSQGEVIYYPWVWGGRKAPDDRLLSAIAHGLAASIPAMSGDTCYKAEYGAGTVGQTYPWLYGTQGTFDLVVETGKGTHIFPEAELRGIVQSNLKGAHYMIGRAYGPGLTGHVTDERSGKPLLAQVWIPAIETEDIHRRTTDGRFGRYWRLLEPGAYTVIISREGYATRVIDHVNVGPAGWTTLDAALSPSREERTAPSR